MLKELDPDEPMNKSRDESELHMMVLPRAKPSSNKTSNLDKTWRNTLKLQLDRAQEVLHHRTLSGLHCAYTWCEEVTIKDVYHHLDNQVSQLVVKMGQDTGIIRKEHEDRVRIFQAATDVFGLFFPFDFEGQPSESFGGLSSRWFG